MKKLALTATLLWCATALAHGGLPVSQSILRKNGADQIFMPVLFWGVWVGQPGQPWKWICEEEINGFRQRRLALSADGTFYATDTRGLTVSTDEGCTWIPFQGELATKRISDVVVHPSDGATAWCTSADSGAPSDGGVLAADNALYVTHDHGASFTRVPGLAGQSARLLQGVRIAPSNPLVIYVTSVQPGAPPAPMLHRSDDGGASFTTLPVSYTLMGAAPSTVEPLLVDPRDPGVVYLRASASVLDADAGTIARQALLRSTDGGVSFTEVLTVAGQVTPSGLSKGIDGMTVDSVGGRVYVASADGLYAADDPGPSPALALARTGNLSEAQCVDVHNGALLACSNNYAPDNAALAQSFDRGASFQTVLRYLDTEGPIGCPPTTPVGQFCPDYWQMYGSQLGIEFNDLGTAVRDGGEGGGSGGGCSLARGGATDGVVLVMLVGVALIVRRRLRSSEENT